MFASPRTHSAPFKLISLSFAAVHVRLFGSAHLISRPRESEEVGQRLAPHEESVWLIHRPVRKRQAPVRSAVDGNAHVPSRAVYRTINERGIRTSSRVCHAYASGNSR